MLLEDSSSVCLLGPAELTKSADEMFVRGDKLVFSVCLPDKTRQSRALRNWKLHC